MSKQVQVNLAFNADTSKAKAQINDLIASLNNIATKDIHVFDNRELREASTAAKELTTHLQNAVNVNTGKLDLNKFTQSLSQSKQSLSDLYNSLSKAGPQGQQAFLKLASSIASSESQVLNLNAKVKDLGQTLKNTIKWQLSSSLVHGFMGAMSQAIGYAKDLNSSLNDIRIVTGASVDEMARFAEQANKSAKALSSTTTEYTKASLIYYQQGLSDAEVKERTDVTIKMANVSRQSAQVVSDQMTAVWNNFADGSKSLEYYADVMTALGATTASSVDEISGGLEKFAAIGDTIGLSFEYAASALATITSNTRQSEEVVGTALKTIFARIQGLNLGETLDDGTTLNKYSAALDKVGISIFDQAGEIKRMDTILDEMGDKWQTLSKDQQIALAQTVAGTRQYTQLVALMDNWNNGDGDSFQANLTTSYGSSGALQEQQDIYAESWEAAADRVKAATEGIYDSLINDEAIVALLNGLEKILTFTNALIDGFGGLKGILLLVGGIFAKQIANEMPEKIAKLKDNFEVITGKAQKKKESTIQQSIDIVQERLDSGKFKTQGDTIRAQSIIEESQAMLQLEKNRHRLSESQQKNIEKSIAERKASRDLQATLADEIDLIKKKFTQTKKQASSNKQDKKDTIKDRIDELQYLEGEKERAQEIRKKKSSDITQQDTTFMEAYERREKLRNLVEDSTGIMAGFDLNINTTSVAQGIDVLTDKLKDLYQQQQQYTQVTEEFQGQLDSFDFSIDFIKETEDIQKQQQEIQNLNESMVKYAQRLKSIDGLGIDAWDVDELSSKLSKCQEVMETFGASSKEIAIEMNNIFKNWSSNVGTDIFQDLISDAEKAGTQIESIEDQIKMVINALQLLSPEQFKELAAEAEKTGESLASLILQAQKAGNIPTPSLDVNKPMEFSTALTTIAGVGMEVTSIISSLGGAISVCFDEGASAGEKFIAVLSAMPGILFSIADIMKTVKSGDFISALGTMGTSMTALAGKLPNIFGKVGASAVKMGTDVAASGVAAGTAAGGFSALGGGLLALLPYIAAVALAIGALVGIIALIDWGIITPEEKLAAAEEKAKGLSNSLAEAEAEAQALKTAFDGYDSAVDKLSECNRKTQEWQSALHDVNGEVLSLMDKYPSLATMVNESGESAISKDSDTGALKIADWAKDRLIEESEQAVSNVRAASIQANQEVRSARIEVQQQDLSKEINSKKGTIATKIVKGDVVDYSSQVGNYIARNAEKFQSMTADKQKADLSKYFEENNIGGDVDAWISAIGDTNGSITALIGAIDANTAATQIENQAIVDSALADSEKVQDSQYGDLITEKIAQTDYQAEVDKQRAWLVDNGWGTDGINKGTGVNDQARTIFDEYAKAAGITGYDLTDTTGTDANRNFVYTDADGQEITVSLDKMLDVVANQKAQEQIQIDAEGLADQLAKYEVTGNDKKTVDSLLKSGLAGLTEEQRETVQESGDIKNIISDEAYASMEQAFNVLYGAEGPNKLKAWLESLNQQIADWQPEQFDLDAWKKDYAAKMDIVNDLETGDSISAEDYTILGEEYQQYFREQLDGTYKLIGTANEFKAIIESIELGKLKEDINTKKGTISQMNVSDITTSSGRTLDFNAAHNAASEGKLHETWDEAYIESINEALKTNYTTVEEANTAWNNYESSLLESASTLAMSIDNFDDLDKVFKEGLITVDDYNKKLKELTDMLDEDVDEEQYENLTEIIQSMAEASDENNEGALEFSENLKDNEKAAKKVAEAILRYDSAVEDVKKNSKDWMKILKSGNLQDMADIMDDLENSYNDLLDLDGSVLSDNFITNAENLELMTKAANGSIEAYDELARRANEDIIAQCRLEADFDSTKFDAALLALQNEIAAIDLPNIEVGCDLMGEESFIAACNDIINAAGMTATEAQAYLGNMGVDATVVSEPEVTEDTTTVVSMIPRENSLSGTALNPVTGLSAPYYFPGADYDLVPETQTTTKTTTATALKVESATKSSGGGIKHANSSSGSGSKSKPSGGGGGSGGGNKTPKYAEKKSSSEKTRYHTLQNQLEDLTAEYDALADASDRAFGQDKLEAIDAEIEKTDELIKKQEEYVQAIQSDLPVDKSIMQAYYQDLIGGSIQFDENGNISNYDQIQDAMFNKYNQMTSLDEDSEEWQVFEKRYEQLEKYIEQYEETYDLLRDEEANYQDLLNQRIDLELEKVEYKVEIELAVPENQKEVIEYQLGRIEDDAKKTGEALALLTEQAEMTYDQILINKQGLNDALELSLSAAEITEVMAGNMDVLNDKTFTEDQISAIQDYKDNLLELNEEFDEIRESIEETVLEAFDMWHEKLEEGIEKFDYFGTILESYQSIIDTVGKDTLGISDSLINTLSQASVDNAINEIEATRDAYKALQQAQIDAERELEKAKARGDEQSISFWESTLNEIQQNAEDAHEEMLDSWEEALSKIVEQFEASIQTAVDAFNEAVYQLGGIKALSEEFDRQKEMADMYLDDYQKIYELSKLNRDVNNSIDDTDSLAGKQKLKKLLGEINKLQAEGVKMSQYDLEYLQAEYDLRMAEIALEEAQRAKDVVRLSRDNEGNWSYVYTQNTEAVDEAQQKYEDALYAMQDLSSNYIDEISAQLIETSQEMQEALAAIRIEDYASIEEYYEEVERVQEQYQEQLALQEEELNKAVANNKELYDTDWTNYHNAVGYKISDTEEFATKFSDTLLGTLMNSESDTSNFTNILADATSTLMNELYGAAEQYYTNMAAAMEAAGTTTDTFADDLATNVDQIKQDSEEAATAVEDMATHMQEQMDNIINKVGEWQRTYGEAMNEIINANLAVIDSFNEMLATLSMDDSTVTVKYDIQNHNSDVLDAERFATGGYTGSWGNTGRLGILDEKELILNKDDTENFIEALKISRSMLNTIELNARQASLGLGTLIPTTVKDDIKETLEQVVQITAEFPNATDHNEIEEAFNMLINRASQFANRK